MWVLCVNVYVFVCTRVLPKHRTNTSFRVHHHSLGDSFKFLNIKCIFIYVHSVVILFRYMDTSGKANRIS